MQIISKWMILKKMLNTSRKNQCIGKNICHVNVIIALFSTIILDTFRIKIIYWLLG